MLDSLITKLNIEKNFIRIEIFVPNLGIDFIFINFECVNKLLIIILNSITHCVVDDYWVLIDFIILDMK